MSSPSNRSRKPFSRSRARRTLAPTAPRVRQRAAGSCSAQACTRTDCSCSMRSSQRGGPRLQQRYADGERTVPPRARAGSAATLRAGTRSRHSCRKQHRCFLPGSKRSARTRRLRSAAHARVSLHARRAKAAARPRVRRGQHLPAVRARRPRAHARAHV